MKRLFIILAAVCMAVSGMAGVTIPQNIYGLRLGKSTKQEVHQILTAKGLELYRDEIDSVDYVYRGTCMHEGMEFSGIVTRYMGDTLFYIGFAAKCDSLCDDFGKAFLQRIHSKYDQLQPGDSAIHYALFTAEADSSGLYKWGRTDGNTLIVTLHNDTTCMCWYFADSFMFSYMLNQFLEYYKAEDPNYSEENKVTGVAGVKFGDSREIVRKVITAKAEQLLESDMYSLNFYKVKIGGLTYDYATFYFAPGKGLISVNLQSSFYSWQEEEAEMVYEGLTTQYGRKYTNLKVLADEPEEKASACGAYVDDYDYLPIIISLRKSLSRGGDIRYYVQVDYYSARRESMYDDEI
jgi:hypothetical protein